MQVTQFMHATLRVSLRRDVFPIFDLKCRDLENGCYVNMTCMSILLYADDILLVAPSVASLQRILSICEAKLDWLDMRINHKKSSCIRFGARLGWNAAIAISTSDDSKLPWSDNFRYLGVYLRSSRSFAYVSCFQRSFRESWANCISGCCSPTC